MSALPIATLRAPAKDPEGAFRYVLKHVTEAVNALTWLSDGLEGHDRATSQHVRALTADIARRAIECLRAWPA